MTLQELKKKYDEFCHITDEKEALEAVKNDGYALRYFKLNYENKRNI